MFFAAGAASSAIDAIQSLTSAATSSTKSSASGIGFGLPPDPSSQVSGTANTGSTTGFSGGSQISPATMQALNGLGRSRAIKANPPRARRVPSN